MSLNELKPINCSDFVFLLGGQDLEMVEIRKILESQGMMFFDNKLQWGAKLSDYSYRFDNIHTFVGIELTRDISPPKYYIDIDHHNENNGKESSLEQIIELLKSKVKLKIRLTRKRQLIAANDKGYIPAMLQLGATPIELANIRQRDKKAQGVTKKDEILAEQSILENSSNEKGVIIVNALTSRFSTITDRLFPYDKLLIYTNNELTYYGKDVLKLAHTFNGLIMQKKAYCGGGEKGYFGIGSKSLSTKELIKAKNEIISILIHQKQ